MPDQLDIHPASAEELIAAHRNVHDIWNKGLDIDAHVESRLNLPSHQRANWFVGCVDGQVVTSLGSYPTEFQVNGSPVPGFAVGSVYTLKEFRGRGYAPRLIEWVEHYERAEGAGLAILYSDVKPEYYAAMGYVLCPALQGWNDLSHLHELEKSLSLTEFDGRAELSKMLEMYHAYHGAAPISIRRSPEYWSAIDHRYSDDRHFWLIAGHDQRVAYARLTPDPHGYRIFDYACADQNPETLAALYRSLLATASIWKIQRLGGWLPDVPISRELFEVNGRATEITMIKPLNPDLVLNDELLASTSRFCELDHV